MRKIYSYKEFRVNEEFLGKLINFFKGFFKKIAAELQKLENDPNKIKEYVITNIIPTLFKQETDNFRKLATTNQADNQQQQNASVFNYINRKYMLFEADNPVNTTANQQQGAKPNANKNGNKNGNTNQQQGGNTNNQQQQQQNKDQQPTSNTSLDDKAFGLIDAILNKDTGVLGKQGIGMLFNDKSLQGDNMKTKRLTIEFIINVTRDQLSKSLKYDQKKKGADKDYLPTFKELLAKTKDGNTNDRTQNVENIIKWVETNIRDVMINNIKAVREDDIKNYIQKSGGTVGVYNVGDMVKYKRDGFIEGNSPDNQRDKVDTKEILRIDGSNYVFKDKTGREFTRTKEQIIGKKDGDQGNEQDGAEVVDDLKNKLSQIKQDPAKMAAINKIVDLINQPGGLDKINKLVA